MKTCLSFFAASLLSVSVLAQTNYAGGTLDKIKEVENSICGTLLLNNEQPSTITERMAKYKVKGLSIAVIDDYKIAWAKGYGWADEGEKRPMTAETLFEPGSISKSLNAVGILKLVQDKKLDLYTDINTYLTSWKFPYDSLSEGKKITLAHLLSHTGGLSVHGFPGHDRKSPVPTVLQVLDGKPPAVTPAVRSMFEPGLKFQYSGGGTTISQLILTDITGKSYDEWMYENVLKPIGMVNSTYAQPPAKDKWKLCATAYTRDGAPLENKFHVYPEQAAAGLWMTPSDLCQYIIDMQLAYKGNASKVLNADMVKLHLTPYNNESAAMGTFFEDHNGAHYFQHSAGNDGFCGVFYGSLDEGYGVALFLNTDDGKIIGEVLNSVAKAYNWKNFYAEPRRRNSVPVDEKIIQTYEGIYLFDNSWASIGKENGEYYFHADGMSAKMYFTSPTHFFSEIFSTEKDMLKDEKGNVTGYIRKVEGKEFPKSVKVITVDTLKLELRQFNDLGWYLMEHKRNKEAIAYLKRGSQLYPKDINIQANMAHAYLFNNDYKHAIAIYKAHVNEEVKPGYSWQDLVRDDYLYFRDRHYNVKDFDKVFAELKMKKP